MKKFCGNEIMRIIQDLKIPGFPNVIAVQLIAFNIVSMLFSNEIDIKYLVIFGLLFRF